jgi:hypothetical protein
MNNLNNSNNTTKYKTINGIQKLPNGTYRIRKSINGVKYSACFKKRKDASKYLGLLNDAAKSIN